MSGVVFKRRKWWFPPPDLLETFGIVQNIIMVVAVATGVCSPFSHLSHPNPNPNSYPTLTLTHRFTFCASARDATVK